MKKNNQVAKAVAAAIFMALVAIAVILYMTVSTEIVYANTDHGEAKSENNIVNSFVEENLNEEETSAQGEVATPVTPADPAGKPDNGLMNLDEMYTYEPHIEKTEENLENMPPEELLKELEQVFNPVFGDVEAAVTADTLIEAINSINQDRFTEAAEHAGENTDSDVGESKYEKAETTTASTTVAETNGITSVNEPVVSSTIVVGVNSYEKKDDTATKTVARIYCPDGSAYEMELTTDDYNLIDLVGEDGDYVINIYQCNGDGYTHVSQHEVTKGEKSEQTQETEKTEKSTSSFRSSKRNESSDKEDTSKVESSDDTTVKTPDTTTSVEHSVDTSVIDNDSNEVPEPVKIPDEETVIPSTENNEDNNNQSDITDSNDSVESNESTKAIESSDDSASNDSAADAGEEFNETETSMTLDALLGMLGGF